MSVATTTILPLSHGVALKARLLNNIMIIIECTDNTHARHGSGSWQHSHNIQHIIATAAAALVQGIE